MSKHLRDLLILSVAALEHVLPILCPSIAQGFVQVSGDLTVAVSIYQVLTESN